MCRKNVISIGIEPIGRAFHLAKRRLEFRCFAVTRIEMVAAVDAFGDLSFIELSLKQMFDCNILIVRGFSVSFVDGHITVRPMNVFGRLFEFTSKQQKR